MIHNRERLLQIMERDNIDYLIASSPENFYYLSEFYSLNHWQIKGTLAFVVYPRDIKKKPVMVIPQCDLDILSDYPSWITSFKSYGKCIIEEVGNPELTEIDKRYKYNRSIADGFPDALTALLAAFKELDVSSGDCVALDERNVPYRFVKELKESTEAIIISGEGCLQETRLVKTAEEVRRLQKAVSITEESIYATMRATTVGMTEKEMLHIYYQEVVKRGGLPGLNCIGVGEHSAYADAQVTDRRVRENKIIRFDIGCSYNFYHADTAANGVIGQLSDRHYEYFEAIKESINLGIKSMNPGVKASEIYQIIMDEVKKTIPQIYRHHVGHGIGIEVYDPPMLTPQATFELEQGMVFCVEVPYYEFEFGGLQVEEVVHIEQDGARVLSKRPVEIIHM